MFNRICIFFALIGLISNISMVYADVPNRPTGTFSTDSIPAQATTTPVSCSVPSDVLQRFDTQTFEVANIGSCISYCFEANYIYALAQDFSCLCMTSNQVVSNFLAVNSAECDVTCNDFLCGRYVANRWSIFNTGFNSDFNSNANEDTSSSTTIVNVMNVSDSHHSITTAQEIGAIVGSIIGFLIICSVLVFIYYHRKRKEAKLEKATEAGYALDRSDSGITTSKLFAGSNTLTNLPSTDAIQNEGDIAISQDNIKEDVMIAEPQSPTIEDTKDTSIAPIHKKTPSNDGDIQDSQKETTHIPKQVFIEGRNSQAFACVKVPRKPPTTK